MTRSKTSEIAKPVTIAKPPSKAMGLLCILLSSFGISTTSNLNAIFLAIGVAKNEIMNAREKVMIYS
ncbi:MAG: hypothetical protein ACOX4M_01235 [Acetivibrionales bacterium]